MMSRYYAPQRGRSSTGLSCLALALALALACACGARSAEPPKAPSPEVVALNDQAEAAERRRDHLIARDLLQQAIQKASDPVSAAYANRKMARMLLFWHEEEQALVFLRASLAHDPKQVPVWNDLGVVHSHLGHPKEARAALEQAVRLDPKQPISRMALAAELVRQSEFQAALSHYKVLLTLDIPPTIEDATHRAIALLEKELTKAKK